LPQIPSDVQYQEILPWLGFMLAGAAGLMWYSYWVDARGYGAAALKQEQPLEPNQINEEERERLRGWISLMTLSNTLAVVGALLAALSQEGRLLSTIWKVSPLLYRIWLFGVQCNLGQCSCRSPKFGIQKTSQNLIQKLRFS
jgi:hypothetical protein